MPSCSNQVGNDILKAVIDIEGRNIPREFIELGDMENVIVESAFNRDGKMLFFNDYYSSTCKNLNMLELCVKNCREICHFMKIIYSDW